jgi:dCMP deaminase
MNKIFLGIAGTNCSGKSSIAKYLQKEKGIEVYSLSDILREEAELRNIQSTVDNLVNLGNELREQNGPEVLATKVVDKIIGLNSYLGLDESEYDINKNSEMRGKIKPSAVIESIRNPAEVIELKNYLQRELIKKNVHRVFYLIAVDAPIELRYQRFNTRKRSGEQLSFKEFEEKDKISLGFNQPETGQRLIDVIEMSDKKIYNTSENKDDLNMQVDEILKEAKQYQRDVYYMGLALKASSRSDCLKRNLGAIVVRNDRILTTGFNGSPAGVPNCNEGGCKRCNDSSIPSGKDLDKCSCVHAEQNAVLQAAYLGTRLEDATIYTLLFPCMTCTKDIIQSGIKRVVYAGSYPSQSETTKLLERAGIKYDHLNL